MIYYANRDTIIEYYNSHDGKEGLAWLVERGILYVIRGDNDSFQWILDGDKLNNAGKSTPLAEIVTRRIIAESENQGIEPVGTEGT